MFSKATSPKENVFWENERQRPPFNGSFSQVSSSADSASFQVPAVKECFNVSDPDTSGISRSCAEALIAEDPELQKSIRGLEAMLRVRASLGSGRGSPLVSVTKVSASLPVCSMIDPVLKQNNGASAGVVENDLDFKSVNGENDPVLKQKNGVSAGLVENDRYLKSVNGENQETGVVAGVVENDIVPALLECAAVRAQKRCIDSGTGDARRATDAGRPGVSSRIHDSVTVNSSGASSHACVSYLDALLAAPARAPAASDAFRTSCTSAVVGLCMHDDDTPMHGAHNSWSDTVRLQGPTVTRRVKGGVFCPAEDLRPVSEVEAGVNFRLAGGVRGQVAGSIPRRQPGTGTRQGKGGVVTPSLHPEVPGIQFVSPGYGLDIRQSMGWTKVCETARSGIWVLNGDASARMLLANLDHLRVEWRKQGSYETAWVTPGHDCLCSYAYGHGAAVRPQTNDAIWDGVVGLWGRVAPLLSPWRARREVPTGVNLNRYSHVSVGIATTSPCSAHRMRLSS